MAFPQKQFSTLCEDPLCFENYSKINHIQLFPILFQFVAVGITLSSALGIGVSQGFALITSVTFIDANVTTLEEALDEEEISWLGLNEKL